MRIDVVGKHIEITPAIHAFAEKKSEKLLRLFDGTQQIKVVVESPKGRAGYFHAEVIVDVEKHKDFVANAEGPDLYAAIDEAVEKAQRQVREYKDKLKNG